MTRINTVFHHSPFADLDSDTKQTQSQVRLGDEHLPVCIEAVTDVFHIQ